MLIVLQAGMILNVYMSIRGWGPVACPNSNHTENTCQIFVAQQRPLHNVHEPHLIGWRSLKQWLRFFQSRSSQDCNLKSSACGICTQDNRVRFPQNAQLASLSYTCLVNLPASMLHEQFLKEIYLEGWGTETLRIITKWSRFGFDVHPPLPQCHVIVKHAFLRLYFKHSFPKPDPPPKKQEVVNFIHGVTLWSCLGLLCVLSIFSPAQSYAFPHHSQRLAYHLRYNKCSTVKLAGAEYFHITPLDVKPYKRSVLGQPQGQRWWKDCPHSQLFPSCLPIKSHPCPLVPLQLAWIDIYQLL